MSDTQKLDYVLSGTSFSRMHASIDRPEIVAALGGVIRKVEEQTDHKFSMLYNAFTEQGFGKNFKLFPDLSSVHADSGGLQVITLGKKITPELMDTIFRNQAAHSDLAMCFDMIPIKTTGATSGRNDVSNRFFDINELESAARATGRNIRRQIEVFQEMKSSAKPILIAQGNCYETYMKWTDYIMDEIPQDMHQYIGGVAMGGAALGTGSLEDIERAFIFSQLQVEKTHLHILGVGAVKRMLPYLAFMKNGLYDGVSVSYDSTTHSSGIEMGNYFHNGAMRSFNRNFSETYHKMYADVVRLTGTDIDIKEFFKLLNTGRMAYIEQGGVDANFLIVRFAAIIGAVINFCNTIDGLKNGKGTFEKYVSSNKSLQPIGSLLDVRTVDQYNNWKATVGRYVKTNRISSEQPATLEDMFT